MGDLCLGNTTLIMQIRCQAKNWKTGKRENVKETRAGKTFINSTKWVNKLSLTYRNNVLGTLFQIQFTEFEIISSRKKSGDMYAAYKCR